MAEDQLSGPQRRSLFAAMKMMEKSMNELGDLTGLPRSSHSVNYIDTLPETEVARINEIVRVIRARIKRMFEKYELNKEEIGMMQIINSKKSYLWSILEDSKSQRLKGIGGFPAGIKDEYDKEIEEFIELISLL